MSEQLDAECSEYMRLLGARIKAVRKVRGLSLRDMVVKYDYHESQWRRYERGGSLTLPSLFRIAKALGLSVAILCDVLGEYQAGKIEDVVVKLKRERSKK